MKRLYHVDFFSITKEICTMLLFNLMSAHISDFKQYLTTLHNGISVTFVVKIGCLQLLILSVMKQPFYVNSN